MIKYKSIKEVMANSSLEQLVDECKLYNLKASYVEYKMNTALDSAGVYFLVGNPNLDFSKIDPAAVVDRQERNSEMTYTDVMAIKITDCNVYATLAEVSDYCRNYEFLKVLSKKYNIQMPNKIEFHEMNKLETLRNRREDSSYSDKEREEAEQALKKSLKDISNKYNNEKTDKSNIVSMDELIKDDAVLKVEELSEEVYLKFKEEIKKHPEVKFYPREKKEIYYGVPAGLFGKESEIDKREVRKIIFRECDSPLIYNAINTVQFEKCSKIPVSYLKEQGPICYASVPTGYMEAFNNKAAVNTMMYAIDKNENVETKADVVNVFVLKKDADMLKAILHQMHFTNTLIHTKEKGIDNLER